jgi:hypothetical protein
MCCGDAECAAFLAKLLDIINKHRMIGPNRCFSYLDQVLDDLGFNNNSGFMDYGNGKIRIAPQTWDPGRFVPTTAGLFGWYGMTQHAVMRLEFKCSGQVAYFDIGSNTHLGQLGGDDHIFFPGATIKDAKTGAVVPCTIKGYLHGSEQNSGN